jgi:hypothetical protein
MRNKASTSSAPPSQVKLPPYFSQSCRDEEDPGTKVTIPEDQKGTTEAGGTTRPRSLLAPVSDQTLKRPSGALGKPPVSKKRKQTAEPSHGGVDVVRLTIPYGKKVKDATTAPGKKTLAEYTIGMFHSSAPSHLKRSFNRQSVPNILSATLVDLMYIRNALAEGCHRADEVDDVLNGKFSESIQKKIDEETERLTKDRANLVNERLEFAKRESTLLETQSHLSFENKRLLKELADLKSSTGRLSQEKDVLEEKCQRLTQENNELHGSGLRYSEELMMKDERLKELSRELAAEKEMSVNSRELYLQQFLGSDAYNKAAHATAMSALKLGCYSSLSAMSKVYPVKPKEVGFQKVTTLLALDLSQHRWDSKSDQLVSPRGDILVVLEDYFPNLTDPVVKHPF